MQTFLTDRRQFCICIGALDVIVTVAKSADVDQNARQRRLRPDDPIPYACTGRSFVCQLNT